VQTLYMKPETLLQSPVKLSGQFYHGGNSRTAWTRRLHPWTVQMFQCRIFFTGTMHSETFCPRFFVNCLSSQIAILNSCLYAGEKISFLLHYKKYFSSILCSTVARSRQSFPPFMPLFFQGLGKVYLSVQPLLPGPMQGSSSIPLLLSCPEPEFLNF
jgi:hypothetical protein